ncbi:MAG: DUF5602 domain-containing protein [Gemmatimonadota bacterium]
MRSLRFLTLSTALLATAACDSVETTDVSASTLSVAGELPGTVRQYGQPVRVGNGRARSYAILDQQNNGTPVEIGVALDEDALEGLAPPMNHAAAGGSEHEHMGMQEYLLPLPVNHGTQFKFIELDWNPAGHEPPGIYDIPHFDFHFYSITREQRDAIVPSDPEFMKKAANFPAADLVPAAYMVLPPAPAPVPAVPKMGVHWSNLTSPEIQPPNSPNYAPFTHTFIYGSWDGQFTFAEPMITRAFLLTKPDVTVPLSPAARYVEGTYSAGSYRIRWDARAREYRVALSSLTKR